MAKKKLEADYLADAKELGIKGLSTKNTIKEIKAAIAAKKKQIKADEAVKKAALAPKAAPKAPPAPKKSKKEIKGEVNRVDFLALSDRKLVEVAGVALGFDEKGMKAKNIRVSLTKQDAITRRRYNGKIAIVTISTLAEPGSGGYPINLKVYFGEKGYISAETSDSNNSHGTSAVDILYWKLLDHLSK